MLLSTPPIINEPGVLGVDDFAFRRGKTSSTGPVEGQINRLTFIKRSMYGRGSFEM